QLIFFPLKKKWAAEKPVSVLRQPLFLALLNLIVDFPLQADAFRGRGRAAFPAGVAAFRSQSTNQSKSTLAFNRAFLGKK
ncbi:MAG: hypothetical protein ACE3JP_06230, partial [Ectobacillus sp.]